MSDRLSVRIEVVHGAPAQQSCRDLWIITVAQDGRCTASDEWLFHPRPARTAR